MRSMRKALVALVLCLAWPRVSAAGSPLASDWLAQVERQIRRAEYHFSIDSGGTFTAPNRAHGLRSRVSAHGLSVSPREEAVLPWRLDLRLTGFGRSDSLAGPGRASVVANDNRVELLRGNLTEWYVNDESGLEQAFTIANPPPGTGKPLVLEMALGGTLQPFLTDDSRAVDLRTPDGNIVLRYTDLLVTDAAGTTLVARMAFVRGQMQLVVDDAHAIYPITVDPKIVNPTPSLEVNQAGAGFGVSVATAGDVNGDGYSDVIVGANTYDNGQTDEGAVFVYLGSSSGIGTSAVWTAESNQTGSNFGLFVSPAGDINCDGYGDIMVSAMNYENPLDPQIDEGAVFIWLGSAGQNPLGVPGTPSNADWTAEGNQAGASFGSSIGPAGDVGGPTGCLVDVVIGARLYDSGQTDEGKVFVYYNTGDPAGLPANASWSAESNQASALLGESVGTAGDVNGDGYAEIIAGAKWYDNPEVDEGAAFAWYGSNTGLVSGGGTPGNANWHAEGNSESPGPLFGSRVATAGDVNGDGFADVIVGAPQFSGSHTAEGKAFVFLGSTTGLASTAAWTAEGDQASARLGGAVMTAGDVNGDGFGDVVIGASGYTNGQSGEGIALAWFGSSSGLGPNGTPSNATWQAQELNQSGAAMGVSVAAAGDVNGDGYGDVIVGANLYDNPQTDEGTALVYHGGPSGLVTTQGWSDDGEQATARFGFSTASAGDVNGDGFSDLIVGAYGFDNGAVPDVGRAYAYLGSSSGLSQTPAWTATGDQASALFAYSVGTAGDMNGDGYADVIIGAYQYDSGQTNEGRAYVYLGGATGLSSTSVWTAESNNSNAEFGWSVGAAGDINGDGYGDAIVGALGETKAYVFLGGASGGDATADWTGNGPANSEYGYSVSTAGDINGDGLSDVLVGAPVYGTNNVGKAYLYTGVAGGTLATTNWNVTGGSGSRFGHSVASAGDVNNDRYSDVIIGAPKGKTNGNEWGKVFVYHGKSTGLSNSEDLTLIGAMGLHSWFGYAVAKAGDVNGDGYGDVIVGAPFYNNGTVDEGGAFAYYGSSTGLTTSYAWHVEGNQTGLNLGQSVAGAFDVDGDTFEDVVVGAPDPGNAGSVLLFHGNGGHGLSRIPRQWRPDLSQQVSLLGLLPGSPGSFVVTAQGLSSAGGKMRLQVEMKASDNLFDGSGLDESDWTTSASLQLNVPLGSVTKAHWRARILTDSPYFPPTRWFSLPGNGPNELDIRR